MTISLVFCGIRILTAIAFQKCVKISFCATSININYLSKIPSTVCTKFIYVIKIPCNKMNRSELYSVFSIPSLSKGREKKKSKKKISRAIKAEKTHLKIPSYFSC